MVRADNGDTQIVVPPLSRQFFTFAFDPSSGLPGLHRISEFTRHRAPKMHCVRTECGREVMLTGDHALWVLRDGELMLRQTTDTRPGDYLPVPNHLPYDTYLPEFDALAYLTGGDYSFRRDVARMSRAQQRSMSLIGRAPRGVASNGYSKCFVAPNGYGGSGGSVAVDGHVSRESEEGFNTFERPATRPVGDNVLGGAPIALTENFLRLLGYYVAGGYSTALGLSRDNSQSIPANYSTCALNELGLPDSPGSRSDYQACATALDTLLGNLCGKRDVEKRLPPFWASLSATQLGLLLRAYFDRVGSVTRAGRITATTASASLASELAYALLRFGISARLCALPQRTHARQADKQVSIIGREH